MINFIKSIEIDKVFFYVVVLPKSARWLSNVYHVYTFLDVKIKTLLKLKISSREQKKIRVLD